MFLGRSIGALLGERLYSTQGPEVVCAFLAVNVLVSGVMIYIAARTKRFGAVPIGTQKLHKDCAKKTENGSGSSSTYKSLESVEITEASDPVNTSEDEEQQTVEEKQEGVQVS